MQIESNCKSGQLYSACTHSKHNTTSFRPRSFSSCSAKLACCSASPPPFLAQLREPTQFISRKEELQLLLLYVCILHACKTTHVCLRLEHRWAEVTTPGRELIKATIKRMARYVYEHMLSNIFYGRKMMPSLPSPPTSVHKPVNDSAQGQSIHMSIYAWTRRVEQLTWRWFFCRAASKIQPPITREPESLVRTYRRTGRRRSFKMRRKFFLLTQPQTKGGF